MPVGILDRFGARLVHSTGSTARLSTGLLRLSGVGQRGAPCTAWVPGGQFNPWKHAELRVNRYGLGSLPANKVKEEFSKLLPGGNPGELFTAKDLKRSTKRFLPILYFALVNLCIPLMGWCFAVLINASSPCSL